MRVLLVPVSVEAGWGRLAAAIIARGGQPRRRRLDLGIVATARIEGVPLLTHNPADFRMIADLVDVREP